MLAKDFQKLLGMPLPDTLFGTNHRHPYHAGTAATGTKYLIIMNTNPQFNEINRAAAFIYAPNSTGTWGSARYLSIEELGFFTDWADTCSDSALDLLYYFRK